MTPDGTDSSLTLLPQATLLNERNKFSITKFKNNKKRTNDITITENGQGIAKVT